MLDEQDILQSVITAIEGLSGDWEYSTDLTWDTRLIGELEMKSLDMVVLCTTLVRQYGVLPLDDLYTKLGEMPPETKELTLGELALFVKEHARNTGASAKAEV